METYQQEYESDMSLPCRLCANNSAKIMGIFSSEGISNDLPNKMSQHLHIQVSENDSLPLQCCLVCVSTLVSWHEFFLSCAEADIKLQDQYSVEMKVFEEAEYKEEDIETEHVKLENYMDVQTNEGTSQEDCMSLAEMLDMVEEDDNKVEDFFIEPPAQTDEFSDEEDGVYIDRLPQNVLLSRVMKREATQEVLMVSNNSDAPREYMTLNIDNLVWTSGGNTLQLEQFPPVNVENNMSGMTAAQYFELFFDDALIELIISASSEYCSRKKWPDINLTKQELRTFLAILIVSGYNKLTAKEMYWRAGNDMRNTAIYEAMRRNRFDNIMKAINFQTNLNKFDKFSKLRPLISHIQMKCMENYKPSSVISHNETMVEYIVKHEYTPASRNKQIRFGYKVWCQNSPSGYLIAFEPYQAKTETTECQFDKCSSTVLQLLDQYPSSKSKFPYHIFCDNLFTSLPMLLELKERGYNCTGTIRSNYLGKNCCLSNIKDFEKKLRGHSEIATVNFENGNRFFVTRWKDKSVVTVISTCLATGPIGTVKRWDGRELKNCFVSIPQSVQIYHKNKGGTEKMDNNVDAYRISIRSQQWWWQLFTWMLDVSVQNAWLLSQAQNNSKVSQLSFRRELAMSYLSQQKNPPKGVGKLPRNHVGGKTARFDKFEHFITKTASKRPRRCAGSKCKSAVTSECSKCNVGLCVNCFKSYHIE